MAESDLYFAFQFVFASEEYPEYIKQYNDVMGIWIDGVNVAIAPGFDEDPISVNTINDGCPANISKDGTSKSPVNAQFFVNNYNQQYAGLGQSQQIEVEYDGLTVLLLRGARITPGTHHIKIAIADVGVSDFILDSAVFVQGVVACP